MTDEDSKGKQGVSAQALLWLERLIWILLYGGLLVCVLGLAVLQFGPHSWGGKGDGMTDAEVLGYFLLGKGGLTVLAGALMIWLRSRWK